MDTITTTQVILAAFDGDAPAKVTAFVPVAEPDFIEEGMAYWIGAEATVAVDFDMLPTVGAVLEAGSFRARCGEFPSERGIAVMPHDPAYAMTSMQVISKYAPQHTAWRLAHDLLVTEA